MLELFSAYLLSTQIEERTGSLDGRKYVTFPSDGWKYGICSKLELSEMNTDLIQALVIDT